MKQYPIFAVEAWEGIYHGITIYDGPHASVESWQEFQRYLAYGYQARRWEMSEPEMLQKRWGCK